MRPQAMEGNLIVSPGDTLQAGYDFTLPGSNNATLTLTVSNVQVVFAVQCVSGGLRLSRVSPLRCRTRATASPTPSGIPVVTSPAH